MNAGPGWALTVQELGQIGFDDRTAKALAGVPPEFDLDGRWVLLIDDQPFDHANMTIVEINGDTATCSAGRIGSVARFRKVAAVTFPEPDGSGHVQGLAIAMACECDYLIGMMCSGRLASSNPTDWEEAADGDSEDRPLSNPIWLFREETVGYRFPVEETLSELERP